MVEVKAEHVALALTCAGWFVSEVLPKCHWVEGNSLCEVLANLARSQCIRPPAPVATTDNAVV